MELLYWWIRRHCSILRLDLETITMRSEYWGTHGHILKYLLYQHNWTWQQPLSICQALGGDWKHLSFLREAIWSVCMFHMALGSHDVSRGKKSSSIMWALGQAKHTQTQTHSVWLFSGRRCFQLLSNWAVTERTEWLLSLPVTLVQQVLWYMTGAEYLSTHYAW